MADDSAPDIKVHVRFQSKTTTFRVKKEAMFFKVINAFCAKMGAPVSGIEQRPLYRFYCDSEILSATDIIGDILTNDAQIDAMLQQDGGSKC
jgi:hypothetical protein